MQNLVSDLGDLLTLDISLVHLD